MAGLLISASGLLWRLLRGGVVSVPHLLLRPPLESEHGERQRNMGEIAI